MDIYQRIEQDHEEHRALAAKILHTEGNSEERQTLWAQFAPEVLAHAAAEEQTFYAVLIEKPDGQPDARHGVHEHFAIDKLIDELNNTDMSSPNWLKTFKELEHKLEHHMHEEEDDIFPSARELIAATKAEALVADFEKRKADELADLK